MDASLPSAAPGEQVTLTGTVGSSCVPGTAEVGMARGNTDEFDLGGEGDPRRGNEIVFLRPDPPGSSFTAEVTMPDPEGEQFGFYAICRQDIDAFESWFGSYQHPYRFSTQDRPFDPPSAPPDTGDEGWSVVAVGAVSAGLAAVAAGAVAVRSMRRRRSRPGGHAGCVARHTAATKQAAAARAAVQVATMSDAARAAPALEQLGSATRDARASFDVLLDQGSVVEALIDEVVAT